MLKRFLQICLFLTSCSFNAQSVYEEDFIAFWADIKDNYAYLEEKNIDWELVKKVYLPDAKKVNNDAEFISFLERVIYELYDSHITLDTNLASSNRIIPSGADVYAEKRGGNYFIVDVRKGSAADIAGIKPGMKVVRFNGAAIDGQLQAFLPKCAKGYNEEMYSFAINILLAGTWDKPREIIVVDNGVEKKFYPDALKAQQVTGLLEYKKLEGNIGYIKINNSLWNVDLIREFDKAVTNLLDTKAIILDLTDTPGGGNTTVARGIMGRFTDRELPYQKHVIDEKQYGTVRSWVEYALPRQQAYKNSLIVMAGHWTGSMGEGIAIGLDGMKRAKIAGTKMAGLHGAVYNFSAPNTKIVYRIPTEKLYHVNGTPREDFIPEYFTANSEETYKRALALANKKAP